MKDSESGLVLLGLLKYSRGALRGDHPTYNDNAHGRYGATMRPWVFHDTSQHVASMRARNNEQQ